METKHTKGTWWACCTKSIPHYVFANEGKQTICAMIQKQEMGDDLTVEEMQANAKLIAAAPDLLDALLKLQYAVKHGNVKGLFDEEKQIIDNAILKATT